MRTGWMAIFRLLMLAGASVAALGQAESQGSRRAATVQVGLWTLWHDKAVTIASGREAAAALRLCPSCVPLRVDHAMRIAAEGGRLGVNGNRQSAAVFLSGPVTLEAHGETLRLANPVHVGARDGELVMAVTLPVESYVERVVASESGSADTLESLKALAIVVRSFALHQTHGHGDYDLCDSTHCQLLHWGGNGARGNAAHAATLATAGETLWFQGERAQAWFHQNCGGRTASPAEVWPGRGLDGKPMPWLASRVDSYCTAGGAREWSASQSLSDLTAALALQGLVKPGWKNLSVAVRGESGRAVTLRLDSTEIPAEDFRLAVGRAVGWNKILSTWFEVTREGDQFFFHGRGSGHGVGLCQAGAAAMAAGGREETQILAQYFPGAYAADEATGKRWQMLGGRGFRLETLDPSDARYLAQMGQALHEAQSRFGLREREAVTVRAFQSTAAFREGTLAPGWVAAFTEGEWIGTQPLGTLAARGLLAPTMRHEFLHVLVERQAGAAVPLWLREGLVEAWGGEGLDGRLRAGPMPRLSVDQVDRALKAAVSERESAEAHGAAGWYAARLMERYGRGKVVEWLRVGVPGSAVDAVK